MSRNQQYDKEAKELLQSAMDHKCLGFELAEKMFDMEVKWPGRGWGHSAHEVLRAWENRVNKKQAVTNG